MKRNVISAAFGLTAMAVFGQGQVSMNTVSGNAYVRFTNPMEAGSYAWGDQFYAALYYSGDYATLANGGGEMVLGGGTNNSGVAIFTGTSASDGGYIASTTFGGNRTIPYGAGQTVYVQLRAWSNLDGTFLSFEAAIQSGNPNIRTTLINPMFVFATPIVSVVPQPTSASPVPQIQWAPGSSASDPKLVVLYTLPEPATYGLLGLGLFGVFLIRRRN